MFNDCVFTNELKTNTMTLYDKLKDKYRIKIDSNTNYLVLKKSVIKALKNKTFVMEVTIEDIYNTSIMLDKHLLTISEYYDLFKK